MKQENKIVKKILITVVFLLFSMFALKTAPSYIKNEITNKTNLVINYTNVTSKMKHDLFIDKNGVIYIAKEDIKNYYDKYIYYDEKYNQIITTSDRKVAIMKINNTEISVNGNTKTLKAPVVEKENTYYLPISELEEIYHIDVKYIEKANIVIIDSLDREEKVGNVNKYISIKYQPTYLSKTIDKLNNNTSLVIIPNEKELNGWIKVRTQDGKIGYIEEKNVKDIKISRKGSKPKKQVSGKISLVWEYFSEYATAPDVTGVKYKGVNVVSPAFFYLKDGELKENVGLKGQAYINWAKQNNYKVWPMVANNSNSNDKKLVFSNMISDSKTREEFINSILEYVIKYDLDGINLDCENIYQDDKNMYSRLVIELAPRLKELGKVLSVDVTAPDGSPDWSLCYDRNIIGDVADYIVFMAYDQNGTSSKKAGTVAGFNWVENNVNKFLKQEAVDSQKIILGIPFYMRLWKESSTGLTSGVVSMRNINKVIPEGTTKVWDEECKQYYIEYNKNGVNYKMWIEDEKSINEKLKLIDQYNLAGAGYWVKGFELDSIWNLIADKLKK